MGWGAHKPPDEGTCDEARRWQFPWLPWRITDSARFRMRYSGEQRGFFFISFSFKLGLSWDFLFQGGENLSLDSDFDPAVSATIDTEGWGEAAKALHFTGICTKHVAEAGSGDTGNSRSSTSELAGPWWECRRRRPSSWAVSAARRGGPCRPRNSGPKSVMRLPWKHVLGPGRIWVPWAAGPSGDLGPECRELKAGLTSEA